MHCLILWTSSDAYPPTTLFTWNLTPVSHNYVSWIVTLLWPDLTLAGPIFFLHTPLTSWCGGERATPLPRRLVPNWARARWNNGRVGCYETQRLIPKFKLSGQLVTSQVRSSTQISGSGFSEILLEMWSQSKHVAPSYLASQTVSYDILFV